MGSSKNLKKIIAFMLCATLSLTFFSCSKDSEKNKDSEEKGSDTSQTISEYGDTTEIITEESQSTANTTTITTENTTAVETQKPNVNQPKYFNPLTGLEGNLEMQTSRPIAIMINNEKRGCPQEGIAQADIMYECLIEGGSSRLMMLVSDYDKLNTIGSVRSSRDYFLDFAQNHDALYVHAGGSPLAYSNIKNRGINNLDGVNMYLPTTFHRNDWRMKNMGYEHSLMTDGASILSGIKYKKYRTELKSNFKSPLNFVDYGTNRVLAGGEAIHVILPYSTIQFPQFIYRKSTNTYIRYQFKGESHIDKTTGNQLEFTNVIVLFCDFGDLNDEKGRIGVNTVGSDTGYYFYGGKYIPIKWSKQGRDTPMVLTELDGSALKLNRGKTFIAVASQYIKKKITLNYKQP